MSDFKKFSKLVLEQYMRMAQHELFVTATQDEVWSLYLAAFPPGTNPIYREKTEHDCSCCRNYIKHIGNLVAIIDGKLTSVWDVAGAEHPYDRVAHAMHDWVSNSPIRTVFRTNEARYGAEFNHDDKGHQYNHFHAKVESRHYSRTPAEARGQIDTTFEVFRRGVKEISLDAVDTVLDLISSKALYRGEEHEAAVRAFRPLVATQPTSIQLWSNVSSPVARLRNTVIGTLLVDLSTGVEMERAVKSIETKVAPMNYKRPSALITKGMVDQAMKTIADLDLEPALQRRFANMSDISVNNVLWVDSAYRGQMKQTGIAKLLASEVGPSTAKVNPNAVDIGIEDFMREVVPKALSMEVFVKNTHQGKFMSLTAPVHNDASKLFRWPNNFGWAYDGNVTDSIKEKVKRAGGDTTAALRVSLAWYNLDDLDIHTVCPEGHVYYGNKMGILDVDMNAGHSRTREPVENLSWRTPKNGKYQVYVNQFCRRETSDVGFEIEIEVNGAVRQFTYKRAVNDNVAVFEFSLVKGAINNLWVGPGLVGGGMSSEKWGVKTETFTPVSTLMYSPNHWDDHRVGNRHWFFILKNCVNPQPVRGIFNEFLSPALEKHRKVFEVLGNKTMCPVTTDQLSGVGYSSTLGDELAVRVSTASSTRQYNIKF